MADLKLEEPAQDQPPKLPLRIAGPSPEPCREESQEPPRSDRRAKERWEGEGGALREQRAARRAD